MKFPILISALLLLGCEQSRVVEPPTQATALLTQEKVLEPVAPDVAAANLTQILEPYSDATPCWSTLAPAKPKREVSIAPQRYQHVSLRMRVPFPVAFSNIVYEANNLLMRDGLVDLPDAGEQIAWRWHEMADDTGGVFILRDSLFSQQDHPSAHAPCALFLPPNWVTAAMLKGPLLPVASFDVEDDQAWTALSIDQLFGSFPKSENLFNWATKPLNSAAEKDALATRFARKNLQVLAGYSASLIAASKLDPTAVAKAGAEIISWGDRRYFSDATRRAHIIPIFVENPTAHELDEGKGMVALGFEVPENAMKLARKEVYARRLEDGDIAIERYDLSQKSERERAIQVLLELIPKGSPGATVWLWVTGPLDPNKKLVGEDAKNYIADFQKELEKTDIDVTRLRFVSKPYVKLKGAARARFQEYVDTFSRLNLMMSINADSKGLNDLIKTAPTD